jgi:hypothetical protein
MLRILELLVLAAMIFALYRGSCLFVLRLRLRAGERRQVRADLERALVSGDYGQIDNWVIMHGLKTDRKELKRIQERRDDLYIRSQETKTWASALECTDSNSESDQTEADKMRVNR